MVFVCVTGPVYASPDEGVVAQAEQAICDFVYLCRRRGIVSGDLATFRNLDRLDRDHLETHLSRYPNTVAREVDRILEQKSALVSN